MVVVAILGYLPGGLQRVIVSSIEAPLHAHQSSTTESPADTPEKPRAQTRMMKPKNLRGGEEVRGAEEGRWMHTRRSVRDAGGARGCVTHQAQRKRPRRCVMRHFSTATQTRVMISGTMSAAYAIQTMRVGFPMAYGWPVLAVARSMGSPMPAAGQVGEERGRESRAVSEAGRAEVAGGDGTGGGRLGMRRLISPARTLNIGPAYAPATAMDA